MKRLLGIFALVLILYVIMVLADSNAFSAGNHQNLARRFGFWGVLTLGAAVVIIGGGIDLSIGAVVGFSSVVLGLMLQGHVPVPVALILVLAGAALIGLFQSLLVTKLRLQPFIVTLCGLFIFRGLAQFASLTDYHVLRIRLESFGHGILPFLFAEPADLEPTKKILGSSRTVGLGGLDGLESYRFLFKGTFLGVPMTLWILSVIAVVMFVLLHRSVYGRYLYAIGYNEQAARYAGIATDRYKILSYVLCSMLAGLGGILELFDVNSVTPSSTGSWYELYAITGAVLGGCSLRGGEGTVAGILLGTAVLPLLLTLCIFAGVPSDLQFMFIGIALLLGTIADEAIKRRAAKKGQ
jgi:ribose transport system permease protein